MADTPPTADQIEQAARRTAGATCGCDCTACDDDRETAREITVAVLRALAEDGDTWEPDQLVALADEIEQRSQDD